MNVIGKLERKFGHLGIPDLIKYFIGLSILGKIINYINPALFSTYLSLDIYEILHGQIWRLVTFLMEPMSWADDMIVDLIWFVIWIFLYYNIGLALERNWGTFRFNLFYFSGVFLVILFTVVYYVILTVQSGLLPNEQIIALLGYGSTTIQYLNPSLFLAFALMNPDAQFLVYFIIPVRAKWLGIVYLLFTGYDAVRCFMDGYYFHVALILGSLLNFAIFFFATRNLGNIPAAYRRKKRKIVYKQKVKTSAAGASQRHRCSICGRTEEDAPNLEFRYCSKCEGSYEYCSDHLFTHEHVHK
ncbi:MAG: hypothetical protein J1F22_06610 [Lachnospiraceae bacterium]|nr:hypothetical protein [Lachnospiraceae bacterium]